MEDTLLGGQKPTANPLQVVCERLQDLFDILVCLSTTPLLPGTSPASPLPIAAHPDDPIQSAIIEKPANYHSRASCHDPHGLVLILAGGQGGQIPATRFCHFLASDVRCKSWFAHHTKVDYQDFKAIFLDHLRIAYN